MPIPGKGKWVTLRCAWCNPRHLMTEDGHFIKGNAERPGILYSDGMCKAAGAIETAKLDKLEAKAKKRI